MAMKGLCSATGSEYPGFLSDGECKRLIFVKESHEGSVKLVEFDVEKVVAAWVQGKFVVPVWLDVIYGRLREKVRGGRSLQLVQFDLEKAIAFIGNIFYLILSIFLWVS